MTTTVTGLFGQRQEKQETALGSGFVVNGEGDIVTAEYVTAGAISIRVAFENGTTRSATVLGKDAGSTSRSSTSARRASRFTPCRSATRQRWWWATR